VNDALGVAVRKGGNFNTGSKNQIIPFQRDQSDQDPTADEMNVPVSPLQQQTEEQKADE